ncbi:coatomer complex protein [Crepidotus variabilis]|uniref:Coatomer subunit epsilon n=1 Tax=Crepidotus variabilis TaxID=179855 RepID=A0A9P6JR59_9AGAR|nr:coatomer complex protein [Crepidotus variabilis]
MVSSDLYHIKQQFVLGAFLSLSKLELPDSTSDDYLPTVLYKARSSIALNEAKSALSIIPSGSENVALKAVASLARYVGATDETKAEAALEELRDLSVEIEGEEDVEGSDQDMDLARLLAGTAFARAGEIEEAIETIGTETEDLESVGLLVQIYLSINRPDLAKKQFERSKRWAEDDLLLQSIESTIGLVTGKDNYANSVSYFTEQLGNPSLSSPYLLTARGITRILRGEIQEAKSDLDESLEQQPEHAETEAAYLVAAGLGTSFKHESDELWRKFASKYPKHPLAQDIAEKSTAFDEFISSYVVPPLAA